MSRFHGRHAEVSLNGTPIKGQSKWSLDLDTDVADTTAFGDPNKTSVQGLSTRKGAFSGFYDTDSITALLDAIDSTTPVTIRLTPSLDNAAQYFEGPAWVNGNIEVDVKDAAKCSAKYDAAGAWTRAGF